MKTLTWPQAAVIVAFLGAITILGMTGRESAALIAVGTALLGGLGLTLGQTQAVRENTNGTMSKLLEMQREQMAMLARMQPPQPTQPYAEQPGGNSHA